MRIEQKIVAAWARRISNKVIKKTIKAIKQFSGNSMLSGDCSGLKNVWEEICVQMQSEKSLHWWAYISLIDSIIAGYVDELSPDERSALWAVSDEGWDYIYDHHADDIGAAELPLCLEDICRKLQFDLLQAASDYSNDRIERFLIQGDSF